MSGLKTFSFIDRLDKLGIDSLERRRLNQGLMLCYKFLNNLYDSCIDLIIYLKTFQVKLSEKITIQQCSL